MNKPFTAKRWMLAIGSGLLALSLAACGEKEAEPAPAGEPAEQTPAAEQPAPADNDTAAQGESRTVTDAMGHEIEVPANPERVLASYLEDHLVALEVKPVAQWSVGEGRVQEYLQGDLAEVPQISYDLPFEAVQEVKPDLILVDSSAMVEGGKYEQYSQIAPTYVVSNDANVEWREELTKIAEVLGKEDKAKEVLDSYNAKAAEAKASIEQAVGSPSAAAVWLVGGKFFVVSENVSSGGVMYQDLGLQVPAVVKEISASAAGNWSEISLEKLVQLDAEHLFLINSDGAAADVLNGALWKSIPAVKAGNVHEYDKSQSWLYTGPIANSQIIDDVVESLVK
ncbi:ABC transporter, substrate-binding protein [Paenibacillus algicola]|uniref:ABC transporter, substrate-binding protein n=1 Tax=Paenibacillus algicola TaxID=2565926 RepID=A0A4P8XMV0_9BACL|nr:ABC transporter substrate-binding protein [Paenibacillus algicola]QCT04156.1 ABC transporter, substrate-binding protein [Paenibacillus algicola]